ncbi:hypothetical protein [Actinomadura sediminis]|uniref:Uncharacterized protein n=1 Tax=Actinomadura sediminis TaxID=1038904 RepID=A0ABW3ENG5_9ACTN
MGRDRLLRHACDGTFLNGYYAGEVTAVAHLHETIATEAMRVFLDVAQC